MIENAATENTNIENAEVIKRGRRGRRKVVYNYDGSRVSEHIANIRRRYMLRRKSQKLPGVPCVKCGSVVWDADESGCLCFVCGAHGHFEGETFVQR